MRKIVFNSILILFCFACKAQNIIPVENQINYNSDIPDGTHIKDVNNLLDKYTGTWVGTYDNMSFELIIYEYTENALDVLWDMLYIKYKITNNNGNTVVNTLNLPNSSPFIIRGRYLDGNSYLLDYSGLEADCGQTGQIFITYKNPTTLIFKLASISDIVVIDDCPNGIADHIFPLELMTLTKQ